MSQGIFIKNSPVVNVNGTYNILSTEAVTTGRIWDSVDNLYRVRYVEGTTEVYHLTSDIFVDPTKAYYKYVDGQFKVLDTTGATRLTELPATAYEKSKDGRWEIIEITSKDSTGTVVLGDVLYAYYTNDIASNPYDTSAKWIDIESEKQVSLIIEYYDDSSFITTVSDPVYDEEAGTTTTVTTITNVVTGAVYKETNVVRSKTVYTPQTITRYDNMTLTLGKVYRFQFVSDFASLGYQVDSSGIPISDQPDKAGIYRVDKILTYSDLVTSGIDLYTNIYLPCLVDKEVYESDKLERLVDSAIYKLVDPTDETIIYYMPQIFIKDTPDPSVDKYQKLMLTIDLGVCPDASVLDNINDIMKKVFEKMWGITAADEENFISLTAYDNVWLTLGQKDIIDQTRKDIKESSEVDLASVFSITTTNRVLLENTKLKGYIKTLEELLIQYKSKE